MVASAFQNYVIARLPASSHNGITLKGKHRIIGLNLYHSVRPYVGLFCVSATWKPLNDYTSFMTKTNIQPSLISYFAALPI
jgi:hypothetical protein